MREAVIHNRRFWWRYADGRMEPVVASPRVRAHLAQAHYWDDRRRAYEPAT
jgi:hypothetical protein